MPDIKFLAKIKFLANQNNTILISFAHLAFNTNPLAFSLIFFFRADNWLVDTNQEPSEHNGLSPFGKVSVLAGRSVFHKYYHT